MCVYIYIIVCVCVVCVWGQWGRGGQKKGIRSVNWDDSEFDRYSGERILGESRIYSIGFIGPDGGVTGEINND